MFWVYLNDPDHNYHTHIKLYHLQYYMFRMSPDISSFLFWNVSPLQDNLKGNLKNWHQPNMQVNVFKLLDSWSTLISQKDGQAPINVNYINPYNVWGMSLVIWALKMGLEILIWFCLVYIKLYLTGWLCSTHNRIDPINRHINRYPPWPPHLISFWRFL